MGVSWRQIIVTVLTAALPLTATEIDTSDSGIHGPQYERILSWMDSLAREPGDWVRLVTYGQSVEGRPLQLLVAGKPGNRHGDRPTLVMTGAMHGNEYLNIEDRLPERLIRRATEGGSLRPFVERGGVVIFVPVLNPDGYVNRRRGNANGVDLNRDWDVTPAGHKGLKEKETQLLAQAFERLRREMGLRFRVTVDYHCCAGALLVPWSYTRDVLPEAAAAEHRAIAELAGRYLSLEIGSTGNVLGYSPLGTTKDYFFSRYGATAFTYEGRPRTEAAFLDRHVAWWEAMLRREMPSRKTALSLLSFLPLPELPAPPIPSESE